MKYRRAAFDRSVGRSAATNGTPLPGVRPLTAPSIAGRALAFFRSHPIVCLAILTPGIPEYLSSSSPVLLLVTSPAAFLLFLAVNVGQYTGGAILIREAVLRWKKGWGTVLLLGLAYGITEEGLGDNTLFNSHHGADGFLGWFGRFDGVNWVWSTGVLAFHVIYSIGLPILLLGLALPATRGRSLVGHRGILVAFLSVGASTALEAVIVYGEFGFWMGIPLLVGCLTCIVVLVAAARSIPRDWGRPAFDRPATTPTTIAFVGFGVFPVLFLLEYFVPYLLVPAAAIVVVELGFLAAMIEWLRRRVGRSEHDYLLVNLAFGFVLWQAVFGVLLTIGLPYTIPLVLVAVWFFLRLRRAYSAGRAPLVPSGALGS